MKLSEVTLALGQIATVFQNVTLTEATLRMWHRLFENESAEQFYAALVALTKEAGRVFFPTPGEVTAMISRMKEGDKSPADLWDEACALARSGYDLDRMFEHMSKISARAARALRQHQHRRQVERLEHRLADGDRARLPARRGPVDGAFGDQPQGIAWRAPASRRTGRRVQAAR